MKAKVKKPFKDKYLNIVYQKEEVIEITTERYEEINSTNHGVLVESIEEKPKAPKKASNKSKRR